MEVKPVALDKQRIVTEAVALLDADGLDGLTLRKLAARLGVQQPSLYWYLPNKAALLTAIAVEGAAGSDPLLLGVSNLLSCAPLGTCTSGSMPSSQSTLTISRWPGTRSEGSS